MRPTASLFALAFTCFSVPSAYLAAPAEASAAPPPHAGPHIGKGKGKKDVVKVAGSGQRLHFSFGGRLMHYPKQGTIKGKFTIVVHPLAPAGDILNVVCRYGKFSNPSRVGNTVEFDAKGTCTSLDAEGNLSQAAADNHITIVNNPGGTDSIDVDLNGPSGIMIPSGTLSHGDFTIMAPPAGHEED